MQIRQSRWLVKRGLAGHIITIATVGAYPQKITGIGYFIKIFSVFTISAEMFGYKIDNSIAPSMLSTMIMISLFASDSEAILHRLIRIWPRLHVNRVSQRRESVISIEEAASCSARQISAAVALLWL